MTKTLYTLYKRHKEKGYLLNANNDFALFYLFETKKEAQKKTAELNGKSRTYQYIIKKIKEGK